MAPVMYWAASEQRKSARSAISSLVAKRRRGTEAITFSRISGVGARRRMPSVSSTGPGVMTSTGMPDGARGRHGRAAGGRDPRHRGIEFGLRAPHQAHLGAVLGKALGDTQVDAAAAAGYEGYFIL